MFSKIFKILLTFILITYTTAVYSQKNSLDILHTADSLFEQKQFTESLELYEYLLQKGYYTPRALIRLSLINEGLGDYTHALHYLNLYYAKIPEKSVLKKMDELALMYNLTGYEYNDLVFFISLYHKYYTAILISILIASALFLTYLYIKIRAKRKLGLRPLYFIFILGFVYLLANYNITPERAIVNKDSVLMSAPAAGAKLLGTINKGHRVTLIDHEDIWYKIKWHDKEVYIRENNLLFTTRSN